MNDAPPSTPAVAAAAGTVLLTLASGQFLMTLDSTSRPPRVADEETWH